MFSLAEASSSLFLGRTEHVAKIPPVRGGCERLEAGFGVLRLYTGSVCSGAKILDRTHDLARDKRLELSDVEFIQCLFLS
jgi:hypothetical protein